MTNFRQAVAQDRPKLGFCNMYPAPGIIERVGPDWDWIWIDGQHGQMGYQDLLAAVRACDLIQRPAFVRVPGLEAGPVSLALDMNATGVIVPCVDTPDQARTLVKAAKFPPLGNRSYGGRRPIDLHGRLYSNSANDDTLLVVQIETPEAIDNAFDIAAIPGVDALFLGPDDISLRRGHRMDTPRDKDMMEDDMKVVADACRRHGKLSLTVGMGGDMLKLCLTYGYDLIVAGGDVALLATGSRKAADETRAAVKGAKSAPASGGPSSPY